MLVVLNRLLNLVRKDNGLLGVNLGKNKTSDADSDDDYVRGIANLGPFADYLVINISSPNTPGLRDLQHENSLFRLLSAAKETRDKLSNKPPLVVKIAPDVTLEELADIASVVEKVGIDGVIIGNTTLSRPIPELDEAGGLSGKPLLPLALKKVSEFYKLTQGRVPIIGCGGISTAQDALEFRKAGATLVQLYTSFVYNGPGVCNQIVSDLNNILTEKQTTWQNLHE
jgi:dihydroorotate dehydrogenase